MIAVMLVAILTAMAPATLIVVTLIVLGVFLARLFETDEGVNTSGPWRFLGSIWLNVAILSCPSASTWGWPDAAPWASSVSRAGPGRFRRF